MKKTLATALSAMFLLGTGVAAAQDKDGFASDGGLGGTRIDSLSSTGLGSGRFTSVEWNYNDEKEAYAAKFADAEPQDAFAICARPGATGLLQFEIQMILSSGKTVAASKLKDLEAEDRVCKRVPKGAKGLMAKKPAPLDFVKITITD
jgi:hypothetical protein